MLIRALGFENANTNVTPGIKPNYIDVAGAPEHFKDAADYYEDRVASATLHRKQSSRDTCWKCHFC